MVSTTSSRNIFLVGFGRPAFAAMPLALAEAGVGNVKVSLGHHYSCTFEERNIRSLKLPPCETQYSLDPDALARLMGTSLLPFVQMFTRPSLAAQLYNLQDAIDAFHMYVRFFDCVIARESIHLILFANVPHAPHHYLLYELAKVRGIPTICYFQSLFPDRHFILGNYRDLLQYDSYPEISSQAEDPVELRPSKYKYFYMERSDPGVAFRLADAVKRMTALADFVLRSPDEGLKRLASNLDRAVRHRGYRANLSRLDREIPNRPFVYFPLHLQPELTTLPLGEAFSDQALAIEQLAQALPSDWAIVVKENPKQGWYARGSLFFERLRMLENIKLLPADVDSIRLVRESEFTATITGTAGWEALQEQKPVVYFGIPWYASFPGAFRFSTAFQLADIVNFKADAGLLRSHLDLILERMGVGIVNPMYTALLQEFRPDDNVRKISASTARWIQEGGIAKAVV